MSTGKFLNPERKCCYVDGVLVNLESLLLHVITKPIVTKLLSPLKNVMTDVFYHRVSCLVNTWNLAKTIIINVSFTSFNQSSLPISVPYLLSCFAKQNRTTCSKFWIWGRKVTARLIVVLFTIRLTA